MSSVLQSVLRKVGVLEINLAKTGEYATHFLIS